MRIGAIAFLLLIGTTVFGQSKRFALALDSMSGTNVYLEEYSWESFFRKGIATAPIDPDNPDHELLDAALFFAVNRYRAQNRRGELQFHEGLYQQARAGVTVFSRSKFDQVQHPSVKRLMSKTRQKVHYEGRINESVTLRQTLIPNRQMGAWHFGRYPVETPYQLFQGVKPKTQDTSFIPIPLKGHTYASFATAVVRQRFRGKARQLIRSRAMTSMAVSAQVETWTLRKNRPPTARVMIVLGGYRTQLLLPEQ